VSSVIYIEGGGDHSAADIECRKAFSRLFERMGFGGKLPSCRPFGNSQSAYEAFLKASEQGKANFIALLLDSEEPISEEEKPWDHLSKRRHNKLQRPEGATDSQVLLMVTCMETWFVADLEGLKRHFETSKKCMNEDVLPNVAILERKTPGDILAALESATRNCQNTYKKGRKSYSILSSLDPEILTRYLKSFKRIRRILAEYL
jgi:hypothetical protein